MPTDPYPIRYRHGRKKGQVVTLAGLLGTCEVCGGVVERLVWDRREVKPFRNYMGFWCRRFSPIEPPHRRCPRHMVEEKTIRRFETEADWQAWVKRRSARGD